MARSKTSKVVTTRTAEELGDALRLSPADAAEMEFRSDLTAALARIIKSGRLTHAEVAKRAGTSRSRVTAIANGNTQGVSTDVMIRVLAATGHRAEVRVAKAGAPRRSPEPVVRLPRQLQRLLERRAREESVSVSQLIVKLLAARSARRLAAKEPVAPTRVVQKAAGRHR